MPSPPKPWEVNNSNELTTSTTSPSVLQTTTPSSVAPAIPNRSSAMGTGYGGYGTSSYGGYGASSYGGYGASNYGGYGTSSYGGYGASNYGGYGTGYGTYSSPYSRLGMGYGSSYGGYNSYSPYNRFGSVYNNRFGTGGGGAEDFNLTQRMESGTRATFDILESIVSAFGGFAQMLDSTYMATHSSFMAMVGVAEQFGHLKHYLGDIFSLYALIRWLKRMLYKLTGRTPPPELSSSSSSSPPDQTEQLQITENGEEEAEEITHHIEQPFRSHSKRSVLFFLALITGLPYLMYKLIQKSNEYKLRQRMIIPQISAPPPEIARVIHNFIAESPIELDLRQGEMIHVLSKVDPATGLVSEWWQGRNAHGDIGVFPANFVQIESNHYNNRLY
ncbi:Peroxin 13, N-terminal region-domain-containing protein [Cokeromyces recurvatus]|uniref:Peroxin 13, N-terminal region-domain-containing protein n=1 Tax=Cokeromyces recurvatus TaxID=90255 RepID=UPI00221E7B41|nr:Peroxin 13, N-terminal region-domain-containing protein [Cokeromyces recurvatus]KAI7904388.1 Peroxin 13, N-terminal region-domain-containing protein [Cokeromyces recurvatus]